MQTPTLKGNEFPFSEKVFAQWSASSMMMLGHLPMGKTLG
jgi:hypothetical protein